jgi:hypothetical protein
MQKIIKFRPLRRIKKTDKITVASYMQWRKIKTADYNKFNLIIDSEYKNFNPDEYVYNHMGEILFWYNHTNPESLPKNYPSIESAINLLGVDKSLFVGEEWKMSEPISDGFHWSIKGFDCDGVPIFTHYTEKYIITNFKDISVFKPLTVGMVNKWFGWFLWKLNNSDLKIGK